MKCNGKSDLCPDCCDSCSRFQDDCEGSEIFQDCDCGSCGECRDRQREEAGENRMECERNGD